MSEAFDLDQFSGLAELQNEGIEVDILDPAGSPLGWKIRVAGPDSSRAKEVQKRVIASRLRRRAITPPTPDEIEVESVQALADLTIGWTPVKLFGGDFPFSNENARKLYSVPHLAFVREQVNAAAGERSGFFSRLQMPSSIPSAATKKG